MGQSLNLDTFQGKALTVIIYWKPKTGSDNFQNGHAALVIDTTNFSMVSNDEYVSWVGDGQGVVRAGRGLGFGGHANTYWTDMNDWGGNATNLANVNVPSRWVCVQGLNVQAMLTAWGAIKNKPGAHWKLTDKNCATTVARVLKAGGADALATAHKHQLVWWPSDLIRYGRSMRGIVAQS
jgi:hypothetical protein